MVFAVQTTGTFLCAKMTLSCCFESDNGNNSLKLLILRKVVITSGCVFFCASENGEKMKNRHKTMAETTKTVNNPKKKKEKLANHLPLISPQTIRNSSNFHSSYCEIRTATLFQKKNCEPRQNRFVPFLSQLAAIIVFL